MGGGEGCNTKKCKEMHKALLKFPEGYVCLVGSLRQDPSHWGGLRFCKILGEALMWHKWHSVPFCSLLFSSPVTF